MALNKIACQLARSLLKGKVLCLGVPIVLLTDAGVQEVFGVTPRVKLKTPQWVLADQAPDPYDIFEQLGVELTCVDAFAHDGREVIADLNYPQELGEFDLVIDAGTTEHCFNVGQALINAANAVKVGGHILHTSPVSMGNHGFYNFCPTLFWEFYSGNGFRIERMEVRGRKGEGRVVEFHHTSRFPIQDNLAIYCIAKRQEKVPLTMPVQGKYKWAVPA